MGTQVMKGLTQFVVDLRNSKDIQDERKRVTLEISNIRRKFSSQQSMSGQQRKKQMYKLAYIYLLGFQEVEDIFVDEAYRLLESKVYSEKQLGYFIVTISCEYKSQQEFPDYVRDIFDLVYSQVLLDLRDNNEDFNCLALEFIASKLNLISDDESPVVIQDSSDVAGDWLELTDIVYSLSIGPNQSDIVKQKAAIALKTLLTAYPLILVNNESWTPRLLTLIDEPSLSIMTASIPLTRLLIDARPQNAKSIIYSVSKRLYGLVVGNECPQEYYYYDTPAPWLVVKLLQLVEHMFLLKSHYSNQDERPVLDISTLDQQTLNNLRSVISLSIKNASQPIKGLPNRNSQSSILFQSVSLAVFLDASLEAIKCAMEALMLLVNSSDTNTRYLALDTLIKLVARTNVEYGYSSAVQSFERHLRKMYDLLNDRDISVKRKVLDLLFTICNSGTYEQIIDKLLKYFAHVEHQLKAELSIKVAVLAEKFATNSTWYVSTMLRLLSLTGGSSQGSNYVGDEVWERIVQIIVNNEDLHVTSCILIINLLSDSQGKPKVLLNGTPENLIKVAAFILGEYGLLLTAHNKQDLFAEDLSAKYMPIAQFQLLLDFYFKVSINVKTMLLTTFFKFFIKLENENFLPDILDLFEAESLSIDTEIQTRAHEYLKLCTSISTNNLEKIIVKPFPAFENKVSPLLTRLGSVNRITNLRNRSSSFITLLKISQNRNVIGSKQPGNKDGASLNSSSYSHLPLSREENTTDSSFNEQNPFLDKDSAEKSILSPHWGEGYLRMCHYDAGIFFEDQLIKITYRIVKDNYLFHINFNFINKSAKTTGTDITNFKVIDIESHADAENPGYILETKKLPDITFQNKTDMEILVRIRDVVKNSQGPIIQLSYKCGASFNQLNLKFPVILLKTLTPSSSVNLEDFKMRWLQIGELLGKHQGESTNKATLPHRINASNVVRFFLRIGFTVVNCIQNSNTLMVVMGAGILRTQKSNYGVLCIVRCIDDVGKVFEICVRCTGAGIATLIADSLKEILESKL